MGKKGDIFKVCVVWGGGGDGIQTFGIALRPTGQIDGSYPIQYAYVLNVQIYGGLDVEMDNGHSYIPF